MKQKNGNTGEQDPSQAVEGVKATALSRNDTNSQKVFWDNCKTSKTDDTFQKTKRNSSPGGNRIHEIKCEKCPHTWGFRNQLEVDADLTIWYLKHKVNSEFKISKVLLNTI